MLRTIFQTISVFTAWAPSSGDKYEEKVIDSSFLNWVEVALKDYMYKWENHTTYIRSVHTNRVKVLHSVVVHLRAGAVWVTLLQGVILKVHHCTNIQFLVKLWTKFIPKHKGHCPTLVSNFKVCLNNNRTCTKLLDYTVSQQWTSIITG